jgi:hypothetical protein
MVQFCLRRTAQLAVTLLSLLSLVSPIAKAQERGLTSRERSDAPTIFDVRKSLPMEPTEAPFHDFYINAGSEAGFKRGQYLPIRRSLPVHDPIQNKQQAVLTVPVGNLLVIHVDRGLTVARLVQELGNEDRPTLEFEAVMIGDHVDLKGITMSPPKAVKPKKSSLDKIHVLEVATSSAEQGPVEQTDNSSEPLPSKPNTETVSQPVSGSASSTGFGVQTLPVSPKPKGEVLKTDPSGPKVESQRVTQPVSPPTA